MAACTWNTHKLHTFIVGAVESKSGWLAGQHFAGIDTCNKGLFSAYHTISVSRVTEDLEYYLIQLNLYYSQTQNTTAYCVQCAGRFSCRLCISFFVKLPPFKECVDHLSIFWLISTWRSYWPTDQFLQTEWGGEMHASTWRYGFCQRLNLFLDVVFFSMQLQLSMVPLRSSVYLFQWFCPLKLLCSA